MRAKKEIKYVIDTSVSMVQTFNISFLAYLIIIFSNSQKVLK